jgi:hypothetical protein
MRHAPTVATPSGANRWFVNLALVEEIDPGRNSDNKTRRLLARKLSCKKAGQPFTYWNNNGTSLWDISFSRPLPFQCAGHSGNADQDCLSNLLSILGEAVEFLSS